MILIDAIAIALWVLGLPMYLIVMLTGTWGIIDLIEEAA